MKSTVGAAAYLLGALANPTPTISRFEIDVDGEQHRDRRYRRSHRQLRPSPVRHRGSSRGRSPGRSARHRGPALQEHRRAGPDRRCRHLRPRGRPRCDTRPRPLLGQRRERARASPRCACSTTERSSTRSRRSPSGSSRVPPRCCCPRTPPFARSQRRAEPSLRRVALRQVLDDGRRLRVGHVQAVGAHPARPWPSSPASSLVTPETRSIGWHRPHCSVTRVCAVRCRARAGACSSSRILLPKSQAARR